MIGVAPNREVRVVQSKWHASQLGLVNGLHLGSGLWHFNELNECTGRFVVHRMFDWTPAPPRQLKQLLPEEMRALKLPEARRFTKHIYSTVVRQETGQTLSALEGLHTVVGVVDAHEKAHDCVLRFSQSSLIRKAQVLYMANNAPELQWREGGIQQNR